MGRKDCVPALLLTALLVMPLGACGAEHTEKPAGQFRLCDYVKNVRLWKTPGIGAEKDFQFEIELLEYPPFDAALMRKSIEQYGLGDWKSELPAQSAREWGYSLTHLDGVTDGAGNHIVTGFSGKDAPRTRREAVEKLRAFIFRQYIHEPDKPWLAMNGHYPWHHYACEFGAGVISSEIGENINSYQWHIALTRGAARQYGLPWGIDFSDWHGPSILDNTISSHGEKGIWKESLPYPCGGHSLSLMERAMVMSYMSGADSIVAEAGSILCFYPEKDAKTGLYRLSPYGEVCRKVNGFTVNNPDVGIACTPIALVLDYYHGAYSGFERKRGAFCNFPYGAGDRMTWELIDLLWPGGWELGKKGNEAGALTAGPYGDSFDVLLQNAPQEALNSYPALLLSGDVRLSEEEAAAYRNYAEQGGTLILNTAYLKFFPEFGGRRAGKRYDLNFGEGRVIVYGPDFSTKRLGKIIGEVLEGLLPLRVSGGAQWLVSVRDGSMFVTLLNNDGVTKTYRKAAKVRPGKGKSVVAEYCGGCGIESVRDIYNGEEVRLDGNRARVYLPAGGIAVLEFRFE